MSDVNFPVRYTEIREWARKEGVTVADAERRYGQYLILQAISRNNFLRRELAFKGGNALEFVYLPNRSTTDLDFSFVTGGQESAPLLQKSETELSTALLQSNDGFGTVFRLQSMKQNPPR